MAALRRSVLPGLGRRGRSLSSGSYACIKHEQRGSVALITLDRPKALNALSSSLVGELMDCARAAEAHPSVGAIVVTGSGKAFAAGADIREMSGKSYMEMYEARLFSELDELQNFKTPIIAAVNGFALGGGCELAMACDIVLAADSAVFGQPEIKLGTIPGLGGTQRFTRAIGKSRAMELVLSGDHMSAEEAVSRGLASRVVPAASLVDEAVGLGAKIASNSKPIVALAKACVHAAFETSLAEGLRFERQTFYSTFATSDQKIGMAAFAAKETPDWEHK